MNEQKIVYLREWARQPSCESDNGPNWLNCRQGAGGTESPGGGDDDDDDESSESNSSLLIGLAMGFTFIIVLVVVLCLVWKFCCKMMSAQANGKVTPFDDDENPTGAGGRAPAEDHTEGL